MNYYAAIDTNVLISSLLKPHSIPDMIVQLALKGTIIPLINEEIIEEYKDVLNRDKFSFPKSMIDYLLQGIISKSIFLERTPTNEIFNDQDDIVFYEIVMTARTESDAYLITGNKRHFPMKSFIVSPAEMLDMITSDTNTISL